MSRPPTDDNDPRPWNDLLQQVDEALIESALDDPETRAAILAGVRDAMSTLLVPPDQTDAEPPSTPSPHPHIRIVRDLDAPDRHPADEDQDEDPRLGADHDGDDDSDNDDDDDDSDAAWSAVRVHTVHRLPSSRGEEGRILLPEGGTQAVLRASQPWLYRVHSDLGTLTVLLEGEAVGDLHAGQTLDVEGRAIQVRASGAARGRYRRL